MTAQDGKIEAADMGQTCAFCKGRTFRRSRLKFKDVGSLLTLQYPVRCLSCSKRQSVGMGIARRAVPSTVRQVRAAKQVTPGEGGRVSQPMDGAVKGEPEFIGGGVVRAVDAPGGLVRKPIAMPDLHGVRLPHVAQMPPGNGENLA